eukprot:scaffold42806_cov237-Amphora_coffeaeformis.AAC.3
MKQRTKKHRKRRPNHRTRKEESIRSSWVDRVRFGTTPATNIDDTAEEEEEDTSWISLISWNVLAHSYCSRTSQRNLPLEYQKVVFHPAKRKQQILDILGRLATEEADILCLQEVDMDEIGASLRQLGWEGVETPRQRNGGGSGTKIDSCIVYVNPEHWKILEHKVVTFDDLATLSTSESRQGDENHISCLATSNLQGLQQSFLRRNVGLIVRLEDIHTGKTFVLANTHLFWNPNFEYVKFCQIHYLLQQARAFRTDGEPFVLCGDLNSKPLGTVYDYLSQGRVDARRVAPWNQMPSSEYDTDDDEDGKDLVDHMEKLKIQNQHSTNHPPQMRYLLDFTLNKLCRWLRILGQDTALESTEEEIARTKQGKMIIFDRCREEGRTLVTTSTRLMQRSDCPPGTYLISPQSLPHLEATLVHILLSHGVALDPTTFLTRCVVCNGTICQVKQVDRKEKILKSYDAPVDTVDEMEVYECAGCQQGYWWSDRPNSSASRVKGTTTHLFELCLQAGVPLKDENNLGFFDYVDVPGNRKKGWDFGRKGSEILMHDMDVLQLLKNPNVESPVGDLHSAYAHKTKDDQRNLGESLPFTNVTIDFVDTLDYVWFDANTLTVEETLWVPTSFPILNDLKIRNGHVLPSDVFPSDHLAIGARLTLKTVDDPPAPSKDPPALRPQDVMSMMTFAQSPHKPRCDCGCVPAIPSLFEMAERRKQARERKNLNSK